MDEGDGSAWERGRDGSHVTPPQSMTDSAQSEHLRRRQLPHLPSSSHFPRHAESSQMEGKLRSVLRGSVVRTRGPGDWAMGTAVARHESAALPCGLLRSLPGQSRLYPWKALPR